MKKRLLAWLLAFLMAFGAAEALGLTRLLPAARAAQTQTQTETQAEKLLAGDEIEADNPQIERELHEFIKRYHPKPKVYLTYERTAMTGREDPSLRITIDRDIRYRLITEDFDYNNKETYPVMDDESMVLMEVKACAGMPGWLIHEMSRLKIYHTSFSKIGTCFTKHIAPRLHFETQTMKDTVPVYSRYYSHMAVPRIAGM